MHLQFVLSLLQAKNVSNLERHQLTNRETVLKHLDQYAAVGRFPTNNFCPRRVPVFVDDADVPCAVAYLMRKTGCGALCSKVNKAHRFALVQDILHADPELGKELQLWASTHGLSLRDCAMIQPRYNMKKSPTFECSKQRAEAIKTMEMLLSKGAWAGNQLRLMTKACSRKQRSREVVPAELPPDFVTWEAFEKEVSRFKEICKSIDEKHQEFRKRIETHTKRCAGLVEKRLATAREKMTELEVAEKKAFLPVHDALVGHANSGSLAEIKKIVKPISETKVGGRTVENNGQYNCITHVGSVAPNSSILNYLVDDCGFNPKVAIQPECESSLHTALRGKKLAPVETNPMWGKGSIDVWRSVTPPPSLEIVKRLLELGVDPNAQNLAGRAPLHLAVSLGDLELVACLLDGKANPNVLDMCGDTPLTILARASSPIKFIRLLVSRGAKLDIRAKLDMTALELSMAHRSPFAFEELLRSEEAAGLLTKDAAKKLWNSNKGWVEQRHRVFLKGGRGLKIPKWEPPKDWDDDVVDESKSNKDQEGGD